MFRLVTKRDNQAGKPSQEQQKPHNDLIRHPQAQEAHMASRQQLTSQAKVAYESRQVCLLQVCS